MRPEELRTDIRSSIDIDTHVLLRLHTTPMAPCSCRAQAELDS